MCILCLLTTVLDNSMKLVHIRLVPRPYKTDILDMNLIPVFMVLPYLPVFILTFIYPFKQIKKDKMWF